MAKVKLTHVPYRGAPQALADVLGGHIQFVFSGIPNVHGHINSGTLRPLAVSTAKRSALLPDIPSVSESGLVGFDTAIKFYLLAPAGTPRAILNKLNAALRVVMLEDAIIRRLAAEGAEPATGTFEEFAADLDGEEARWLPLVKSLGLKAQ
jgi:tripartite-type tricarboxylate transporter receptor subunit TctC